MKKKKRRREIDKGLFKTHSYSALGRSVFDSLEMEVVSSHLPAGAHLGEWRLSRTGAENARRLVAELEF